MPIPEETCAIAVPLFHGKRVAPGVTTYFRLVLVQLNIVLTRGGLVIIPNFLDTFPINVG